MDFWGFFLGPTNHRWSKQRLRWIYRLHCPKKNERFFFFCFYLKALNKIYESRDDIYVFAALLLCVCTCWTYATAERSAVIYVQPLSSGNCFAQRINACYAISNNRCLCISYINKMAPRVVSLLSELLRMKTAKTWCSYCYAVYVFHRRHIFIVFPSLCEGRWELFLFLFAKLMSILYARGWNRLEIQPSSSLRTSWNSTARTRPTKPREWLLASKERKISSHFKSSERYRIFISKCRRLYFCFGTIAATRWDVDGYAAGCAHSPKVMLVQ